MRNIVRLKKFYFIPEYLPGKDSGNMEELLVEQGSGEDSLNEETMKRLQQVVKMTPLEDNYDASQPISLMKFVPSNSFFKLIYKLELSRIWTVFLVRIR